MYVPGVDGAVNGAVSMLFFLYPMQK